jgi:hypothetical protein
MTRKELLDGKGQKQVSAFIDLELWQKWKDSGFKMTRLIDFGLMVPSMRGQITLLEGIVKDREEKIMKLHRLIERLGIKIEELEATGQNGDTATEPGTEEQ